MATDVGWDSDSLLAKATLFFERALDDVEDDSRFGLWCSLGLELLARSSIAKISPAFLADPDINHRNLLYVFGRGSAKGRPKSIPISKVLDLCVELLDDFTTEHRTCVTALVNVRNEELHTGMAAFTDYPKKKWLLDFYRCIFALCKSSNFSPDDVLGAEEAKAAKEAIDQYKSNIKSSVDKRIGQCKAVFDGRDQEDRTVLANDASARAKKLAYHRHHVVTCPACGSDATVQGETYGEQTIEHDDDDIIVRQQVAASNFYCPACSLNLENQAELQAAGLDIRYTRRTSYTPAEYYNLIDPDNFDPTEYIEDYLRNMGEEYDNE